jgi:hypothetical protein
VTQLRKLGQISLHADRSAQRVARRFFASYFSTGSIVLYGKYKNHRGKIVAFGEDKWGNPTIEVEPIPKGRKQNKVLGLFRVWRADVKENAMKKLLEESQNNLVRRVVARHVKADGIDLGRTFEIDSVRIHRFADHFKVTDLTNAGKRGKQVRIMTLSPSYSYKGSPEEWMMSMARALPDYPSYDRIKAYMKDVLHDFPGEININESTERGVDVNPGGTTKIQIETNTGLKVTAEPMDFTIVRRQEHVGPKGNKFNQDTLYYSRDKKNAQKFYNWLKANLGEANRLDLEGYQKLWDELGVKYDYH